jgi:hypothetical protein
MAALVFFDAPPRHHQPHLLLASKASKASSQLRTTIPIPMIEQWQNFIA